MAIVQKKVLDMEEDVHTVTKSYGLFGYYANSEEELAIASRVLSGMLEFIQSQGIDIHFRRKPTIVEDYSFEEGKPVYQLTMRAALLPSDTEIGKQYDHSHGPVQINLNGDSEKETS